jgi:tetratricopeptide (TPR) repeat protein
MQGKTHYEVLGVPESATGDEIKKRYREMARKYHPDVATDKELAAQIFALITEAYKTLSDTDSRKSYDAELLLKKRRGQEQVRRASGFGAMPTGGPRDSSAPRTARESAHSEADRLITQAQAAFVRNKMSEARNLAEQARRYNPRSAAAFEVLGDISRVQGKTDEAIGFYTMVLQIDPRNGAVRQRMERMARASGPFPAPPSPRSRAGADPLAAVPEHKRPIARLLVGLIGYAGVALLLLVGAFGGGNWKRAGLPLVSEWSLPLVALLVLCGLILGATMAATGAVRRIEDDFLLKTRGVGAPLGGLMMLVGALCFWIAGLVHLAIALVQESHTSSLLRVYGSIALTTVLATLSLGGGWQTLVFGGNVVLLAYLLGWFAGDYLRGD